MHAPLTNRQRLDLAIAERPELELYRDVFEQALGRKRYKRAYARFDTHGTIPKAVVDYCNAIIDKDLHKLHA